MNGMDRGAVSEQQKVLHSPTHHRLLDILCLPGFGILLRE